MARGFITHGLLRHLPHFAIMPVLATTFYYYGFAAGTALLPTRMAWRLSGSIPIFTFICAWLLRREDRLTARMAAGVALGFVGIALSAPPWEGASGVPLAGVLWMLAGTLSVGVSFVYARLFLLPLALATWQTGLATLTLLVLTEFTGISAIATENRARLEVILGLGVLGTGGAFLISCFIIAKLGPMQTSGATYIAPIVAVIIGAAVGERITALEILALILGGVVLIQTGKGLVVPSLKRATDN